MIVLTSKKYEVEETIKAVNENEETLYEFQMQITPNEIKEIREIILDEAYTLSKEKNEDIVFEKSLKLQNRFEKICFKEHILTYKQKVGEEEYLQLVDTVYSFFMNAFIEKKMKQMNTINSNLKKIGNN